MSGLNVGDCEQSNRREFYRVHFPVGEELTAIIDGLEFQVLDVCERGMRLAQPNVPNRNGAVQGAIHWHNGSQTFFIGHIGRKNKGHRVIWQIAGITTRDILNEQRRLIRKFPQVKSYSRLRLLADPSQSD